ncbi:PsbP-related protein [Alkalinema sp. FACHB-956]|uniref:PsbP-related protein n=1 Tax=Alkalinema sp. FACHB-956 TaxID=2692768 RepID=UPI0016857906|nr:PsbP-related protein [Alkalinema sp. FACHB-956]MBD2326054.1 hypothetical protein [Alkalinema sp. FACHB-956]
MKKILWTLSALLTILLPALLPATIVVSNAIPSQAQTQKAQLKTYKIDRIQFKAPSHWVDRSEGETITLYNQKPPIQGGGMAPKGMVKLAAFVIDQSLEDAVKPAPRGMSNTIQKTERLRISGQPAVRIYATSDEADFIGSVTTYIAKNVDETIVLITFYQSAQVPASVNQIHRSIQVGE